MSGIERIQACFSALQARGHKALVAYLCMGDPSFDDAIENAITAAKAGADLLELGVPFSDPVADGPVLERAALRAISAGGSLVKTIEAAEKIRARTPVPLVLFTYFNPLFVAGPAVIAKAAAAGIDAILVVDLPGEEGADFRAQAREHGVAMIPLLTPTSTDSRIEAAGREASGFVYYVSLTGITGAAAAPLEAASIAAEKMREITKLPVVVGFGIDSADKARTAAGRADGGASGVVIGTALVNAIDVAQSARDRGETGSFDRRGAQRDAVRTLIGQLRAVL